MKTSKWSSHTVWYGLVIIMLPILIPLYFVALWLVMIKVYFTKGNNDVLKM